MYELQYGSDLFPVARTAKVRHALMVAGIDEFAERGVDGASARRIAANAGQNVASIAYYFGSKEGLYQAIASYVVEIVNRRRMGPQLEQIEEYLSGPKTSRQRSLRYLIEMLSNTLFDNDEMVALSQMIVREQTHPTAAFERIFKDALERPHRVGAALIADYVGEKADRTYAIHYHLLLGSVLAMRVARQTLLRRTGWAEIGPQERTQITTLLAEHVSLVLRGLRAKKHSKRR